MNFLFIHGIRYFVNYLSKEKYFLYNLNIESTSIRLKDVIIRFNKLYYLLFFTILSLIGLIAFIPILRNFLKFVSKSPLGKFFKVYLMMFNASPEIFKLVDNKKLINNDIQSSDTIIIGSGPGGATCSQYLEEIGSDFQIFEEGKSFNSNSFNKIDPISSIFQTYRNAGFMPIHSKALIGFGEGSCLGGGSLINGGLMWRTPEKIMIEWNKLGLSYFNTKNLNSIFDNIENLNSVSFGKFSNFTNLDSLFLLRLANKNNLKIVEAPKAVSGCSLHNRCGSGCTSGAKVSVIQNLLNKKLLDKNRVFSQTKVEKINIKNSHVHSVDITRNGVLKNIKTKKIILSAGVTSSPKLLIKSGIIEKSDPMQIHLNIRILINLKHELHSEKGTMFTHQIQEYEDDDIYIMMSNYSDSYVAPMMAHVSNEHRNKFMNDNAHNCMLVVQYRSKISVDLNYIKQLDSTVLKSKNIQNDIPIIKFALKKTTKILFNSSAVNYIILPFKENYIHYSYKTVESLLDNINLNEMLLTSVHGMSSLRMGESKNSKIDLYGRVRGVKGLYVHDSSSLPSNIGESPQMTIMALARYNVERNFIN